MITPKRGRKSLVAQQNTALFPQRRPPPVPGSLSAAAAALWLAIVGSLPPDYFRPGDLPLLQSFCVASDRKNTLDAMLLSDGLLLAGEAHPALKLSRAEAALLATLGGKLRLNPSSRSRPESARLALANASERPWDDGDNLEDFFSH